MVHRRLLLAAGLLPVAAIALPRTAPAEEAVQAMPTRLRGTIEAVQPGRLMVKERGGNEVEVTLPPNVATTAVVPAQFDDIKPGTYIGTAALPQPDGTLLAREVHIFPAAMHGVAEGQRPWDLEPGSTMTNATVASVSGVEGRTLLLTYKGAKTRIVVPPQASIITYQPGGPDLLKPGASILVISATRHPDGTLGADRLLVGKDGLRIPM